MVLVTELIMIKIMINFTVTEMAMENSHGEHPDLWRGFSNSLLGGVKHSSSSSSSGTFIQSSAPTWRIILLNFLTFCCWKTGGLQGFQNLIKIEFWWGKFLKCLSSINLPWGHVRSYTKFRPDRLSRFDVFWIQTNRQAKYKFGLGHVR